MTEAKKLTPAIKDKLLLLFRLGYKEKDACTYVGISIGILNGWIEQGKITQDEILFAQHALRNLSVGTITKLIQGKKSDMKEFGDARVSLDAAKWWLEYKHSNEFRKINGLSKFLEGVDIAQLITEANKLDRKEKRQLKDMKEAVVITEGKDA